MGRTNVRKLKPSRSYNAQIVRSQNGPKNWITFAYQKLDIFRLETGEFATRVESVGRGDQARRLWPRRRNEWRS